VYVCVCMCVCVSVFPSLYLGTNDSFLLNKGMSSSLDGLGKNNINLLQGAHVFHTENSIIIPILNRHNA